MREQPEGITGSGEGGEERARGKRTPVILMCRVKVGGDNYVNRASNSRRHVAARSAPSSPWWQKKRELRGEEEIRQRYRSCLAFRLLTWLDSRLPRKILCKSG